MSPLPPSRGPAPLREIAGRASAGDSHGCDCAVILTLMDIMVTGGTGFIGSHIVQALVQQGHHVTVLARNPTKVSGFLDVPGIDFVEGTLRDRPAVSRAL